MVQQGIELPSQLIPSKIRDHQRTEAEFTASVQPRIAALKTQPQLRADFRKETQRFLPAATVRDTIGTEPYWIYLTDVVGDLGRKAVAALKSTG